MDRSISTPVKNQLFGETWKSDISNLKSFKDAFARIKSMEFYLPYAAFKSYESSDILDFTHIDKDLHDIFKNHSPLEIYYVVLFLREGYNKQTLGIELTTNVKVIPQLYNRKREYYYEWNSHKLTIRRILGTFNEKKIDMMVKELMKEYKRFYLMYCKN